MNTIELSLLSGTYWWKKNIKEKLRFPIIIKVANIIILPYTYVVGLFFKKKGNKKRKTLLSQKKTYNIALVTIAKNESKYIEEWIAFHKAIGIDKIYLYDNGSDDNMVAKIKPFIDEGFVTLNTILGSKQQLNANNDAIKKYGSQCKYMAFIDCDEMLMPTNLSLNINNIIDKIIESVPNAGGIGVNWCMFGSSHHNKQPKGLVCENFVWRAKVPGGKGTECIKTIAIPECIKVFKQPHYPIYKKGFYNINTNGDIIPEWYSKINNYCMLKLNHYFTKSKEEWIARHSKGHSCMGATRTLDDFNAHDNNDILDEIAITLLDKIKDILATTHKTK